MNQTKHTTPHNKPHNMNHTPIHILHSHHGNNQKASEKHKKKKGKNGKMLKIALLSIFVFLFVITLSATVIFGYLFIFDGLPSPYALKDYKVIPISSHIFDRNGKLLYEIYSKENRTPVKLEDLPDHVTQASIAIEDKDFYEHGGVSLVGGILRAMKDTYQTKELQGGSTITQQLVKSALLTPERTIQRKMKEILLAVWAERIFSKEEILEMYVNQVPYGGQSYGIEEGAKTFFGKSAKDLTIDEAALLAGLPRAPSIYSPYINPEVAQDRRDQVLKLMYEQGYISKEKKEEAQAKDLVVVPPKTNIKAPHFVFYVKSELEKQYGTKQVEEGGLQVTTTLDLDIQQEAQNILQEEIDELEGYQVSNGAVLVTRPPTGEILAMVGSVDYFASPSGSFNVTTALRQPGSSIKPINYAIGIDRGIVTAATPFLDVKTCFEGGPKKYCPKNYDNTFHGAVQLRYALANSYNIPAVKMMALNGVDTFISSSSAFLMSTFKDPSNYGLSLTLGGGEVKMTEMAQAFSAFPNRGRPVKLNPIIKIENKNDDVIYSLDNPNFVQDVRNPLQNPNYFAITSPKAISEDAAFIISHILADNAARTPAFGPTSELVIPNKTVSVKTGTTDNIKDNWTIGFTPNFLTAVWVGNNDGTPMNPYLTSGVTGAAPIWNRVMTYLLDNQPDLKLIKPSSTIGAQVCKDTGRLARGGCPTRFEYIIEGTDTTSTINISQREVPINRDTGQRAVEGDPNVDIQQRTVLTDEFSQVCIDCGQPPEE
jgi:penicillin-binding protein 1C